MKMIKTIDTSGIKRVFAKHGKLISVSSNGPSIMKEETLEDVYPQFSVSLPIKELSNHFSSEDLYDTVSQLLFTSFMLNNQSNPYKRTSSYCPSSFSTDLVAAFSESFRLIFQDMVKKTRLIDFTDSRKSSVKLIPNENKYLNAFVFPEVKLLNVFTARSMDAQLNSVKDYMFKDFPKEMSVPKNDINPDTALNVPLLQWHFYGSFNGIHVYMLRLNRSEFAMQFNFDLPFVLPLGRYSKQRMISVFTEMFKKYSIKGI